MADAVWIEPRTVPFGGLDRLKPEWHADALCREYPLDLFFGGDTRTARDICALCIVATECLEWALAAGPELAGVWSGTTPRDRQRLRRRQRAA